LPGFEGFQRRSEHFVPVPEEFFSDLLPHIRSIVELKLTLHLMWVLSRRSSTPRCIEYTEMANDSRLLENLRVEDGPRPGEDYLREGLELAVTRGSVLRVHLRRSESDQTWFFLNTSTSREAVNSLQAGMYGEAAGVLGPEPIHEVHVYRPNIFALYEQNIGPLTPMIADKLQAAETQFPAEWIEEAISLSVEYNKRNWRYVEAILQRWEAEGKDDGVDRRRSEEDVDPEGYFRSKYQHLYR
jgi:DNA replication protein